MQYLVDRYDKDHKVSYPRDAKEHWEVNNWVSTRHGTSFATAKVLIDIA